MRLVQGNRDQLPSYVAALQAGWSADNVRGAAAAQEEVERIRVDPDGFLAGLYDPEAKGDRIKMPDGSTVARIPGVIKWMWDGAFCGSIGLRWVPGTEQLPLHCLGHIGYSVVPWKRGLGYATKALNEMLPEARARGLRFVELTTDLDNIPSQRVVLAAGGVLVEQFTKPAQYGGKQGLRFRIEV